MEVEPRQMWQGGHAVPLYGHGDQASADPRCSPILNSHTRPFLSKSQFATTITKERDKLSHLSSETLSLTLIDAGCSPASLYLKSIVLKVGLGPRKLSSTAAPVSELQ